MSPWEVWQSRQMPADGMANSLPADHSHLERARYAGFLDITKITA